MKILKNINIDENIDVEYDRSDEDYENRDGYTAKKKKFESRLNL